MKVDCCHHLFNPFSQGSVKLKTWQKGVAITSLVALAPLLLFPGLIAFWGSTYYFKATQLNLQQQDTENAVSRTHTVSRKTLSSTDSNNDTSIEDTSSSSDKESTISSSLNSLPLPSLVSEDSYSDIDESVDEDEPVLPFSNLSEIELLHEKLERFHYSAKIKKYFNSLHSSKIDKIAIFERLKKQVPSWQEYLGYLSQRQFEDFNLLFGIALDTETPEIYMDFIKALDPGQLNEHLELLNNCQIIFEGNVLPVHKTLLRQISPYFDKMFSSGMSEAQTNEIHLQEKEDYELFEKLLPSVMSFYFFDKRLDLSAANLTKYLELANKYQLSQLKETCTTWILENFENIDRYDLFDLADQYCLESVKSTLVQEILQAYHSQKRVFSQSQKQLLVNWVPRVRHLEIQDDLGDELEPLLNLCTNLHTLNITLYDKQTIKLLKELPSLKNLAITDLYSRNSYREHGMEDLPNLPITSMRLMDSISPVRDEALEHLKDLPLKSLTLRGSRYITDKGLAHLKKLPLESLVLNSLDQITDQGLAHLKDLPIKRLTLRYCKWLTDDGLDHLKKLPLESLVLVSLRQITDKGLEHLKDLPIKSLTLRDCSGINDKGLTYLKKLPLKSLVLESLDQITDQGLEHLKDLPIKSLTLGQCQSITDHGFAHLKKLPLESLALDFLEQITDQGLKHLKKLPLKNFILDGCFSVSNNGFAHLKKLPLESLVLKSLLQVTDQGLEYLKDLPLKSLTLRYCSGINDKGLIYLKKLPLESLVLESLGQITGQGLKHLKTLPLESLALEALDEITDQCFEHLKDLSFKSLALYSLPYVTDQGLAHLEELPLKSFTIERCGRIKRRHIANLRKAMPHTQIVFLP